MSEREPGELAYQAWMSARYGDPLLLWEKEPSSSKQRWAAVEAAIRADERAERLDAEIERLREALKGVIRIADRNCPEFRAARAALKEEK